MKKFFLVFAVLAVVLCVALAPVRAELITIAISGQVSYLQQDYRNPLGNAINLGDVITGTYTYDSAMQDSNPSSTLGDYTDYAPPAGIWLSIGGFDFKTKANPSQVSFHIGVYKDSLEDQLVIASNYNSPLSNGILVDEISWQLNDSTGTALSSDALPPTAPDLNRWTSNGLTIDSDRGGGFLIGAHITSATLVPEPATIMLFGLGLLLTKRIH